jgi:hypothetical protein
MNSIPEFLQKIIEKHRDILLCWFSHYIYELLLHRFPDHPLVGLNELLDFGPLEAACQDYHKQNGLGTPVIHTVPRLLRVVLLRFFYDKSLRQVADFIRENMMAKWFAGYSLAHFGLSHTTIHDFETYLIEYHPRLFFDTILSQILQAFPEQRALTQIGDTFAMLANAQWEGLINRLRHTAACLLLTIHRYEPTLFDQVTANLDLPALLGDKQEKQEFLLDENQKNERLKTTVSQVLALLQQTEKLTVRLKTYHTYKKMLQDILDKEVAITLNEAGQVIAVQQKEKRGTYYPISATDPDATVRKHGPKKVSDGYNVTVMATTDFICEIAAATGAQPDAAGIVPALQNMKQYHDLEPPKVVYDQAAGHGKTIEAVHEATDGQTQLVVKPVQAAKNKEGDRFGPRDCLLTEVLNQETGELLPALLCPAGEITTTRYRSGSGDGWNYRMPAATCLSCPLNWECRKDQVQPTLYRQFFVSVHHEPLLKAVAYAQTEEFKLDMKLRPHIERIIAGLVLHCGARHAIFRGLEKVDYQAKACPECNRRMQATVYNLKRWLNLSDPNYRPPPRRTAADVVLALAAAV